VGWVPRARNRGSATLTVFEAGQCRGAPVGNRSYAHVRAPCWPVQRDGPRCWRVAVVAARRDRDLLAATGLRHRAVWCAWKAKEVVRQTYDHTDAELAALWVDEIARDFTDGNMPFEVRRLGRTIGKWRDQIVA
jgi:hypothetical protein